MSDLFSKDAEYELLGAIMKKNDIIADVSETLKQEDFFIVECQVVYAKSLALYKESKAIDPITIWESLQDKESIPLSKLMEFSKLSASPNAYKTYVGIVKDKSDKRKLKSACDYIIKNIETEQSDKLLSRLNGEINDIADKKHKEPIMNTLDLMSKTIEALQMTIENKGEGLGMKVGWNVFDDATNGFVKGDYVILAARPSMGKTAVVINLVDKLADKGYKSLVFEQEMKAEKIGFRLLSMKAKASLQRLYKGKVEELEMMHILAVADKYSLQDNIYTDVTAQITLLELRNKVRKMKMTKGVDVVFVDHIGLSKAESKRDRHLELSEISKGLKAIAKDYDVCMVVLSQLNRSVESRQNKRPMLSDLRESGSLEEDSDIVIGLYRDEYYNQDKDMPKTPSPEEMEFILLKNRDGKTGTVYMMFDSVTQFISEGGR